MAYQWDVLNKKTYNNRAGKYKFEKEYGFILANGHGHFERILDVAGGSGRMAIPLLEYSSDITVIDKNEDAIRILKERNSKINAICGDFNQTPIQGPYSLILCIEALGDFKDYDFFFNKIKSALSEDGRFIFSYLNPGSWRFLLRRVRYLKTGPTKYNLMKLKDLKKYLKTQGLKIDSINGMNWQLAPLASNSIFVNFYIAIEKLFGLNKWYSQSPMLMISVSKDK